METNILQIKRKTKMKWEDHVMQDIQTVKIKMWTRIVMNRSRWRETVEQDRTHQGL
jgi:hypothetical protein